MIKKAVVNGMVYEVTDTKDYKISMYVGQEMVLEADVSQEINTNKCNLKGIVYMAHFEDGVVPITKPVIFSIDSCNDVEVKPTNGVAEFEIVMPKEIMHISIKLKDVPEVCGDIIIQNEGVEE